MTHAHIAHRQHRRPEWSTHLVAVAMFLLPAVARAQSIPKGSDLQTDSTFTKISTGDIVTAGATYWNGAWGDYDDDGWLDLFVGATFASQRNYLYHNNHDGTFTLIDDADMLKSPSNQHGAAWGDYDNDGHLDLIVTAGNPEITHNMLYRNNGDGTFSWTTDRELYRTFLYGFHAPSWGDYDNDGFLDLFIAGHDNAANRLFRNNGDGSFTRITDSVLVGDPSSAEGRAWVDYDDDGDLDLFVANGTPYVSLLYRNDGNGVYTKVTNSGLTSRMEDTIGCCWADYDNDGFLDVFLANALKNSLYHNNGDGTFTSMTDSAVVADAIPPEALFGACAWADYDNDGFIDLFVTVGDHCRTEGPCNGHNGPPRTHNFLYHNSGDGAFTKVTEGSVVTDLTTQCPGASWGDYDNDGFLDLFVSQGAFVPDPQTNLLYHNDGNGNAWLNVKLVGTVSNRSAIGAKVRVNTFYRGESRWQVREIDGGDSGSNQSNALNAAFGLADATTVDTVRIEWPSGAVQELRDVAPRQFLTITEPLCAGDCTGDGEVSIDDLLTLVNIPLGDARRSACPRGIPNNAAVDIALIIQAVNHALNGCGASVECGTFVTKWGSRGSGDGQFNTPIGIALDGAGSVFVGDSINNNIQKFTNTGTFLTKWGTTGSGDGQFSAAMGMAADGMGSVFVADGAEGRREDVPNNNRIQKFASNGTFLTKWGSAGSGDGELNHPKGVAVDRSGNVYVSDCVNNRIQKFTNTGTFLAAWGSEGTGDGQFTCPTGVGVDESGNVYVADTDRIEKFTDTGMFLTKWGSPGSGDGQFSFPVDVAPDRRGNVYVSDCYNNRIQKFTNTGVFLGKWGSAGSGDGQFLCPKVVAVDANDNVYVTDDNARVQKFACL